MIWVSKLEYHLVHSVVVDEWGCWQWQRGKSAGYARLSFAGYDWLVSRLVWQHFNNIDPGELYILHMCNQPSCVNPRHLYAGTQEDNTRDRMLAMALRFTPA